MIENLFLFILLLIGFLFIIIFNYFCKKIKLIDSGKGIQKIKSFKGVHQWGYLFFGFIFFYNLHFEYSDVYFCNYYCIANTWHCI